MIEVFHGLEIKLEIIEPRGKVHNPRPVVIVCYATYYGKQKDKLGTLVFKDITQKEILIWKHIEQ